MRANLSDWRGVSRRDGCKTLQNRSRPTFGMYPSCGGRGLPCPQSHRPGMLVAGRSTLGAGRRAGIGVPVSAARRYLGGIGEGGLSLGVRGPCAPFPSGPSLSTKVSIAIASETREGGLPSELGIAHSAALWSRTNEGQLITTTCWRCFPRGKCWVPTAQKDRWDPLCGQMRIAQSTVI